MRDGGNKNPQRISLLLYAKWTETQTQVSWYNGFTIGWWLVSMGRDVAVLVCSLVKWHSNHFQVLDCRLHLRGLQIGRSHQAGRFQSKIVISTHLCCTRMVTWVGPASVCTLPAHDLIIVFVPSFGEWKLCLPLLSTMLWSGHVFSINAVPMSAHTHTHTRNKQTQNLFARGSSLCWVGGGWKKYSGCVI